MALVVDDPGVPIALRTDRVLLGHVLRNMVGNALKFTDGGEVRVSAHDADGGVTITVADTGIGIAGDAAPTAPGYRHSAATTYRLLTQNAS